MHEKQWMRWAAAVLSAGLLELPFPLAGPMPPWRSIFAWFGLAPVIWAVARMAESPRRPLRQSFLVAYLCGVLWYMGNCYWIYATMEIHGGIAPFVSVLLLVAFSLVLGAYFGLFGLGMALVRRKLGLGWALAAAPFLWVAVELAGARITCVPWDQLGYSQVDNGLLTLLDQLCAGGVERDAGVAGSARRTSKGWVTSRWCLGSRSRLLRTRSQQDDLGQQRESADHRHGRSRPAQPRCRG